MTQEAKLKKIIEKAVENGWDLVPYHEIIDGWVGDGLDDEYYAILFSHAFAKAIWGEEEAEMENKNAWISSSSDIDDLGKKKQVTMGGKLYELHLMKAVISKNPIDYYYENMEGTT